VRSVLWTTREQGCAPTSISGVRIDDVTDLDWYDWYLDNVVVPSGPEGRKVGAVRAWQGWWLARARELGAAADDAELGRAMQLAARQAFVLSWADVRSCGLPNATTRRLVRQGRWQAVGRGWVAVLAADLADVTEQLSRRRRHALQAAAAALRRDGHLVAGASAVVMHGLPVLRLPRIPELVGPRGATVGQLGGAHVRRLHVEADEVESWFGVPVESPERAIVDLARADPQSGLMAADAALHEGISGARALSNAVQRGARLPGMRRARAVLSLADPLIESPLESLTHLALHDSGFPPPQLQRWLTAADGGRYRVDFLWPELRLVLEVDGRGKNSERERWREKRRDLALERAGYHVVRLTWADVVHNWPAIEHWLRELMATIQTQ
jgi:hypothetical protein